MATSPINVEVLLAFGRLLFLGETVPLTVWMLDQRQGEVGASDNTVASLLEFKAIVDIHQAVEAKFLFCRPDFLEYRATESHQIALNGVHVFRLRLGILLKLFQVACHQTVWAHQANGLVLQQARNRTPDVAVDLDAGIEHHNDAPKAGAQRGIATG